MPDEQNSEQARQASARIGSTLKGKYRIDRVIGRGGMAVVYAVTHRNQAEFAVKMLHPQLSIHPDVCTRFLREGYAANSVKHPGVVLVVDDDIADDGAAFLVMELLHGEGVETIWGKDAQHAPPRMAAGVVDQLLDVLAAAHEKGIVHRDIKPANLFLTHEGVVKVLDFGIARARDALATSVNQTGTGMLLGTPAFMSPEQALAKASDIDHQTDLWAAGATLFTLISGEYVHTGDNGSQLLIRAATQPARSLAEVAPHTPQEIVDVVARALAFEKSARFPSARAMQTALRDACKRAFGAVPTRDSLSAKKSELGVSPTAISSPPAYGPPSPVHLGFTPPQHPPQPAPIASGTLPIGRQPPIEGTTAQPVSSSGAGIDPLPRKKGGPLIAIAATALVVAIAAGVGVQAWRAHSVSLATSIAPAIASSVEVAPTSSSEAPSSMALPSLSASASATVSPSTVPTTASPPPNTIIAPESTHGSHASHVTPASSATAPAKGAKPSCDPPFFFDTKGRKVFKPECL